MAKKKGGAPAAAEEKKSRAETAAEAIAKHNAVAAAAAAAADPDDPDVPTCVICCEMFDEEKRLAAVGACNHPGVCSLCYLRLRKLMKEYNCVLCKTPMEQLMICDVDGLQPFSDFAIWGNDAGPNYVWDETARAFLPRPYLDSFVSHLDEPACGVATCKSGLLPSQGALESHLRERHGLSLCRVCLKHKKVFLAEHRRFSAQELEHHIRQGDPTHGFFGHPRCEFCRSRFYDKSHLFEHLTKEHYTCHLCEAAGRLHKYYRDYADLESHFRSDHYLCEDPSCLAKKFTVFANHIDLQGHMISTHPGAPVPRRIEVNFTVRRSGRDGTGQPAQGGGGGGSGGGGGGGGGGAEQEGEVHEWEYSGPSGAEEEAARRRQEAEDFPALAEGAARQMAGWVRESAAGGRAPQRDDFPSLPGGPAPRARGAAGGAGVPAGGFRAAVQAYPTAAMLAAADEDPWSYPSLPTQPGQQARFGNMKIKVEKPKKKKGGGGGGLTSPIPHASQQQLQQQQQRREAPAQQHQPAAPPPPVALSPPPDPGEVLACLRAALGDEGFDALKALSAQYRTRAISAERYVATASAMMPPPAPFVELFAPLVAMLPDADLRDALVPLIEADRRGRAIFAPAPAAAAAAAPPPPLPRAAAPQAAPMRPPPMQYAPPPPSVTASPPPPPAESAPLSLNWANGGGSSSSGGGGGGGGGGARRGPAVSSEEFPGLSSGAANGSKKAPPQQQQRKAQQRPAAAGAGGWGAALGSVGVAPRARGIGLGMVRLSGDAAAAANAKLTVGPAKASTGGGSGGGGGAQRREPPPAAAAAAATAPPAGYVQRRRDAEGWGAGGGGGGGSAAASDFNTGAQDFPGLPAPSGPRPGMAPVEWGEGGGEGGGGGGGGAGRGAKKKASKKGNSGDLKELAMLFK
ncbi:hypothetical protein JKP88DRAFT_313856 [Tribonema minus]|uniref:RING-type domain-containing protein n=1 Tax=Tribonema minus TaxID=303371 RepID=A0A835Z051_9STRA|nr:hypothetical protein JKP88DRAFT_313856 [Tribonema minus]